MHVLSGGVLTLAVGVVTISSPLRQSSLCCCSTPTLSNPVCTFLSRFCLIASPSRIIRASFHSANFGEFHVEFHRFAVAYLNCPIPQIRDSDRPLTLPTCSVSVRQNEEWLRDLIISLRVLLHVCYCSQYDVCALTLLYSGLTSGMTLPHWVSAVIASLFLYLVCTLVLHCMLVFLCARLCTGYLRGRVHARASAYIIFG